MAAISEAATFDCMTEIRTSATSQVKLQWHAQDGHAWAHVELHNPKRLNAMSVAMWHDLHKVFTEIQQNTQARCVLVTGFDHNFCAGGNISEYTDFRFEPESLRHFHENEVWAGLQAMLDCDVPIIASIEGVCMGAGVEIASCCDIRVATPTALFGAPIAKLGFPMAPRELELVGRTVGDTLARRMLLEAATLSAQELLTAGFLSEIIQADLLPAHIEQKLQKITALAPQAARMNKQTLRAISQGKLMQTLQTAYDYADSREHHEGIDAFLQKRKPQF